MQIVLRCFKSSLYTRCLLRSLYQKRRTKKFNHSKGKALYRGICNNQIILQKQFHERKMFSRHARRLGYEY